MTKAERESKKNLVNALTWLCLHATTTDDEEIVAVRSTDIERAKAVLAAEAQVLIEDSTA